MRALSKEKQGVFDRLIGLGVPEEWAFLIARRVTTTDYLLPGKVYSAEHILSATFIWSRTPEVEGLDFWKGVHDGLISENHFLNAGKS